MKARLAFLVVVGVAVQPINAQEMAFPEGIPPQVNGYDPEPGGIAVQSNGSGGGGGGGYGASAATPFVPATTSTGNAGGSAVAVIGDFETSHLRTLASKPYGGAAIQGAQEIGIDPNATAAIANAESRFRNVPNAAGTTSASGIMQITDGTWNDTVRRNNLPYTAADRGNPEAQMAVGNHIIREYAAATQNGLGRQATTGDTYMSYLMGPAVGTRIAAASSDTPLSAIVPSRSLSNNGMAQWSVGQLRSYARNSLGPAYDRPVLLPKGS